MKVEWLNDDCTKARLVKGWLRPMEAIVVRTYYNFSDIWQFIDTGVYVRGIRGTWLERLRKKQLMRGCWRPIKQTRQTKQLQGAYDSYELVRQVE